MSATLSHAAVWAGLYVAGAVVCVAQVAGIDREIATSAWGIPLAFAFCTATAVYLLDRAKVRDAWLDPADAQAHPARYAFIAKNSGFVRAAIIVLLGAGAYLGWRVLVWGAAVPLVAAAGVLVYAGRPRRKRPRLKDVVLLKNTYVALGIAGFAMVVALAAVRPGSGLAPLWNFAQSHWLALVLSCVHLAARVFADAVLCDLDDEDSDRQHGTGTLPTHLGRQRAWNIAMWIRLSAAAALVVATPLPAPARFAWAGVTVASSVALRVASPQRVRDWVDARLGAEALLVALILAFLNDSR